MNNYGGGGGTESLYTNLQVMAKEKRGWANQFDFLQTISSVSNDAK